MRRLFFVLISAVAILIPCHSFASQADVEKLSGPDYFPAVDKALNEAKKSIFLVMYYIDFRKDETESKVSILVDDLVKEKDRGIYLSSDRRNVYQNSFLIGGVFKF